MNANKSTILFLNHSSELGGGELSLFDIARNTTDREVVLLSTGPLSRKLRTANIPFSIIEAGPILSIRRSDGVWKIVTCLPALILLVLKLVKKARHARLLYANSQKAFVAGALVSIIARRPLIWHLRDLLTGEHFSSPMRKLTVILANRRAAHVIANSAATALAFRAAGGTAPVTIIHSCIDPAHFEVAPALLAIPSSTTGPYLGLFSRIAPWKGQDVAIRALVALPGYRLALVGSALFGEEAYAKRLHTLADELGVADRVHFLGFRHDAPALMRAVDIVVHCSTSPEPFGRVIVEGMLARKPVIATAAGGALEIIEDGVNGFLVKPGDANALAQAVQTLTKSPQYASLIAAAGYSHAVSNFSLVASNAQVREIIELVG